MNDGISNQPQKMVFNPEMYEIMMKLALTGEWKVKLLCRQSALKFRSHFHYDRHTRACQRHFCRWAATKALKLADQGVIPSDD